MLQLSKKHGDKIQTLPRHLQFTRQKNIKWISHNVAPKKSNIGNRENLVKTRNFKSWRLARMTPL